MGKRKGVQNAACKGGKECLPPSRRFTNCTQFCIFGRAVHTDFCYCQFLFHVFNFTPIMQKSYSVKRVIGLYVESQSVC